MSTTTPDITIPVDLLPTDGRFGCGPSKVRPEAVEALAGVARSWMGTSHRQAPVREVVSSVRRGVAELLGLPDGYEVVLGNGGSTVFWDIATFGLIDRRSLHLVFGEFRSKFAAAAAAAPHLAEPERLESPAGTHPELKPADGVDVYALTHNETSTGVAMAPRRPDGVTAEEALVVVDATSAAGGLRFDPTEVDVYYFAPQKNLGADGGLWLAACSPAAIERIGRVGTSGRWIPTSLDLVTALDNSRKEQTYNTPALATLFLLDQQLRWLNGNGGLDFAAGRSEASAATLYGWAEASDYATPFVADPAQRSTVVGTVDIDDAVDVAGVNRVLRAHGIVDTDAYRKLGRNQLRIGMFPAVEPDDVARLTACIDHVVGALA